MSQPPTPSAKPAKPPPRRPGAEVSKSGDSVEQVADAVAIAPGGAAATTARSTPAAAPASAGPPTPTPSAAQAASRAASTAGTTANAPSPSETDRPNLASRVAPGTPTSPLTFGRELWACFDPVLAAAEADVPMLRDVSQFLKQVADAERVYASSISKASGALLGKGHLRSARPGSMTFGMSCLVTSLSGQAQLRSDLASSLDGEVAKMEDLANRCASVTRALGNDGRALQREEKDQLAAHQRTKLAFLRAAEEEEQNEAALADARRSASKDLDKFEKKHVKLMQALEASHDEYAQELGRTNSFVDRMFGVRMHHVLDGLQAIFEEVRRSAKSMFSRTNELFEHALNAALSGPHAELGKHVASMDATLETQQYIQTNVTLCPGPKPEVLNFCEYAESAETTRRRRLERQPTPRGVALSFTPTQVFAIPLDRALERQMGSPLRIPKILRMLLDWMQKLGGTRTEGVFRVPALRSQLDRLRDGLDDGVAMNPQSVHDAAGLLRLYLRELGAPIIPYTHYARLSALVDLAPASVAGVLADIPNINASVLTELIGFLSVYAEPAVTSVTLVTLSNLVCFFAPAIFRSPSPDYATYTPLLDNELRVVRFLIANAQAFDAALRAARAASSNMSATS